MERVERRALGARPGDLREELDGGAAARGRPSAPSAASTAALGQVDVARPVRVELVEEAPRLGAQALLRREVPDAERIAADRARAVAVDLGAQRVDALGVDGLAVAEQAQKRAQLVEVELARLVRVQLVERRVDVAGDLRHGDDAGLEQKVGRLAHEEAADAGAEVRRPRRRARPAAVRVRRRVHLDVRRGADVLRPLARRRVGVVGLRGRGGAVVRGQAEPPRLDVPFDALVDRHERDLPDCFGRSAFLSLPAPLTTTPRQHDAVDR